MSAEKPGWVAARAEGRGSVKAVSTRGKGGRGQAKASSPPLHPPRHFLDPEGAGCQLSTSPHHLYTALVRNPCLPGNWVCPVKRELFPDSSGPEGHSHTGNQQQR